MSVDKMRHAQGRGRGNTKNEVLLLGFVLIPLFPQYLRLRSDAGIAFASSKLMSLPIALGVVRRGGDVRSTEHPNIEADEGE